MKVPLETICWLNNSSSDSLCSRYGSYDLSLLLSKFKRAIKASAIYIRMQSIIKIAPMLLHVNFI